MSGLHPATHPPERVSLTCPLGLRFVDVTNGTLVTEGLGAIAWPAGNPHRRTNSIVTPSGAHAFHGLPGLRTFENSAADDPWNPPPATRQFQVEVSDEFNRFLPCTFTVNAPAKGLAVFADDGSPPWIEGGAVPLFTAPWRPVPAGLAVFRAELRDLASAQPAAWAFVEATYSSAGSTRTARGLADNKGRVALMFGYPEGQRRAFNISPPGSGRGLAGQEWTLALTFFHHSAFPPELRADYTFRLAQPPILAWRDTSPITPVREVTLLFGRELDLGIIDLASA